MDGVVDIFSSFFEFEFVRFDGIAELCKPLPFSSIRHKDESRGHSLTEFANMTVLVEIRHLVTRDERSFDVS